MEALTNLTEEQRKILIDALDSVKEGVLIPFETEYLEALLFDTYYLDAKKERCIKLPVCSGPFLRKLDLSKVDFSSVSWIMLTEAYSPSLDAICEIGESYDAIMETRDRILKEKQRGNKEYIVDYSGTNANIDLTTSYEAQKDYSVEVASCNFEGVDMSQDQNGLATIELFEIYNSNLGNTNLVIPNRVNLYAIDSSLYGIRLNGRHISAYEYCYGSSRLSKEKDYRKLGKHLPGCNLCQTGINIDYCGSTFKLAEATKAQDAAKLYASLREALSNNWRGCYFNCKYIKTSEERYAIANRIRHDYREKRFETIKASLYSKIDKAVAQVNKMI